MSYPEEQVTLWCHYAEQDKDRKCYSGPRVFAEERQRAMEHDNDSLDSIHVDGKPWRERFQYFILPVWQHPAKEAA